MDWAGIIVERVTGQKLGDYFQEHIFAPLDVQSTTFFPTNEMKGNIAKNHQRGTDGNLVNSETPYPHPLKVDTKEQRDELLQAGGHGLYSRPTEYVSKLAPYHHLE